MFKIEQKYNYEADWKWAEIGKTDTLENACAYVRKYCPERPMVSGISGTSILQTRIIDESGKTYSKFAR